MSCFFDNSRVKRRQFRHANFTCICFVVLSLEIPTTRVENFGNVSRALSTQPNTSLTWHTVAPYTVANSATAALVNSLGSTHDTLSTSLKCIEAPSERQEGGLREETDFGQSRFGHPALTNLGQSNLGQSIFGHRGIGLANLGQNQFWPIQFWPIQFWIWCVLWWGPKGGAQKQKE